MQEGSIFFSNPELRNKVHVFITVFITFFKYKYIRKKFYNNSVVLIKII